jgi:uncharacterized protein
MRNRAQQQCRCCLRRMNSWTGLIGEILALQQKQLKGELSESQRRELKKQRQEAELLREGLDRQRMQEVETIRRFLRPFEARANLYMGGVHVLGFQLIRIIKNDLVVFGSAIALMICFILLLLFRRLRWVLVPALCCACSLLCTTGLFAWLGFKTTVISSSFIALQLILTLAIVVHLIVQYRELQAEDERRDAAALVSETLKRKAAPCFFAGLTTSIGFASLLLSGIGPVVDFGWMMVIALAISIAVSLVLFPALLVLFHRKEQRPAPALLRRVVDGCQGIALNHAPLVIVLFLLVLAAGVAGSLRLTIENSFINYFRSNTRVHRELTFIDRDFGGSTPLNIIYTLPESERADQLLLSAETVQQMQRIEQRLQRHEAVGKVLSVTALTAWARQINNDRPITEYELTAIYRLMEEELKSDLLGAYLKPEALQARFNIRIRDTTPGLDRSELLAGIRSDFKQLGIAEERYKLTGLFVLYQNILQRLFRSQSDTLIAVYIAVLLAFMLIFRSIKVGLIALVPNLLSTAVVLGTIGWLGIPLDLMTITVAAVAMGIAVDDTIHYIHRYREELSRHSPDEAVVRSHGGVGHAILYTTLIITLGCSLFAFSSFVPSIWFGLFTGLAMVSALLGDLVVLPVLLKRFVTTSAVGSRETAPDDAS